MFHVISDLLALIKKIQLHFEYHTAIKIYIFDSIS